MSDIVERLRFDAARCEILFSKGVADNIEEAADEIERLRTALASIASGCCSASGAAAEAAEALAAKDTAP